MYESKAGIANRAETHRGSLSFSKRRPFVFSFCYYRAFMVNSEERKPGKKK